jgi:hypothetical protein
MTFRKTSFLRRLQQEGHLDDFFLALTEEKDMDRATAGLAFLGKLGVKSSRTAVYEAYRLHFLDWQQDLAVRTAQNTPDVTGLDEKLQKMIRQRTFETVARPDLTPGQLATFARVELQRKALAHEQEKFKESLRSKLDTAMDALKTAIENNPVAAEAFARLKEAVQPA